jgi:hypothetical protein
MCLCATYRQLRPDGWECILGDGVVDIRENGLTDTLDVMLNIRNTARQLLQQHRDTEVDQLLERCRFLFTLKTDFSRVTDPKSQIISFLRHSSSIQEIQEIII